MNTPLLITAKINLDKKLLNKGYSKSIDPEVREKSYFENICYYLIESDYKNIIFCESSNTFLKKEFIDIINCICLNLGKMFEYITFQGDNEKTNIYGYGYGEVEIINYAISNSKILNENDCFYKISGRYKVININEILEKTKNIDNCFWKSTSGFLQICHISTAFFKTNIKFFKTNLSKTGELSNDNFKVSLELAFFEKLKNLQLKYINLKVIYKHEINKNLIKDKIFKLLNLDKIDSVLSKIIEYMLYFYIYKKRIDKSLNYLKLTK